jgi:trans-feruloyl-CoA hydratase/vanillin synthase
MTEYATILVDRADGVATVTLNRPEKRNAMNPQLHLEMLQVLEELRYDAPTRVVVLTGAGESFCAGMDLKEVFMDLRDKPVEWDRIVRAAIEWRGRTLRAFPKPTIAMVNGFCFGGAFGILEGCDLAVAAEEATFGLSEVNFKLFPGGVVSKALANLLRPRDALFYGMTGRPFDGKRAAEIGLVNYAVPRAQLRDDVMALARELAAKDPHALKATKDGYRYSLTMEWESAMDYAAGKQAELTLNQRDAWRDEGIGAFMDKKFRPGLEGHESTAAS